MAYHGVKAKRQNRKRYA